METPETVGRNVGRPIVVDSSAISSAHAEALFNTICEHQPTTVLEIGLATGVSATSILSALDSIGGEGLLISIDPNQTTQWKNVGLESIARANFTSRHELIEEFDYFALPELLRAGISIDLGYIDGWHTFDYALLDIWYVDKMLTLNGILAINDCHLPAVHRAIQFLLTHRKYEEMDVGLDVRYDNYAPWKEPGRLILGRSKSEYYRSAHDRYFRKVAEWEPGWDFYAVF